MNIILYTTHCPKCRILETKLKAKNIEYQVVTDAEVMIDKGFMSSPMLEIDDIVMDFSQANKWVNEREEA